MTDSHERANSRPLHNSSLDSRLFFNSMPQTELYEP
jgi:hypothetical protein